MKTKLLLLSISIFFLLDCCGPAPYEDILKNDSLTSFITRTFTDFIEINYTEQTMEIYDLTQKCKTFTELNNEMKQYCKDFKTMYINRFLFIDNRWTTKWKPIFDEYFSPEVEQEIYLTAILILIKKGLQDE
jgi:hypothetical protein